MKLRLTLAAALLGALASQAQAQEEVTCTDLVAQVDALLAAQSEGLNEEVLGQIMSLRNQGENECTAGEEENATESLEHAISLFSQ